MTQEEIIEYNKRCAEFLGNKLISKNDFNMLGEHAYTGEHEHTNWAVIEYLNYHHDWNGIMEVIEAIEKKSEHVIMGRPLYDSFDIGKHSIKFYFSPNNKYLLQLELSQLLPDKPFVHTMYKHHIIKEFDFKKNGKKEAVVQAINQFLIWYNENNRN